MSQPVAPPARPPDAPVHPLAAALLVGVDNLWNLADWVAVTWLLTIPLSFFSVAMPVFLIQRRLHRDGWGKALFKGALLGVIAAVPTSVTGTPVGVALLTWAGILRSRANREHSLAATASVPAANAPPPLPVTAEVITAAPAAPARRAEPWWVKLAIIALLCGTALLVTKMVLGHASGLAAKFRQEHITETFVSALPTLARTPGGTLELATATATETLRREDEKTVAWDLIYLGKTVSEISVPVTYRFHVLLRDPWRLEVVGQTCVVHAPTLRPSLPPAIHTDQMQKRSEAGWARFDAREQLAELERSLTPRLARHAGDPQRLALVREECRKTVGEFVRDWLLREDHWRADRFTSIQVSFADEPKSSGAAAPVIRRRD